MSSSTSAPSQSGQPPNPGGAQALFQQTTRVGQAVQAARRDLASTHAVVQDIHALIAPTGDEPGENPVIELLEQVLLALRQQAVTLDSMDRRLAALESKWR